MRRHHLGLRVSKVGRKQVLLFVIGVLCLQAAWILTVPAFRGIDEIDHSYRAASVVRGDWEPATRSVPDGRGLMVFDRHGDAAGPACPASMSDLATASLRARSDLTAPSELPVHASMLLCDGLLSPGCRSRFAT